MMYMHNQEQYNHEEVRHDEVMRRVQIAMSKISGDDVAAVLCDLSDYQGEEIASLCKKLALKDKTIDEEHRWLQQLGAKIVSLVQDKEFEDISNGGGMSDWEDKQKEFDLRAERTGLNPRDLS